MAQWYFSADRNRRESFPLLRRMPAYVIILLLTTILSILGFIIFAYFPIVAGQLVLTPRYVADGSKIWTIFTHLFLHANFFHLFVNMFSLFFIGSITEMILGKRRLFLFYILAGLFAGLFFIISSFIGSASGLTAVLGDIDRAGVGASGSLFGLLGVLAVLIPRKKVYLIVGPLLIILLQVIITPFIAEGLRSLIIALLNILMFLMIFSFFLPASRLSKIALPLQMPLWLAPILAIVPLIAISFFVDLPIGNMAHFGGLLIGLFYGFLLRLKYKRKIRLIKRIFK